jgi:serine/threonine protein phosphatase 1
MRIIAISDIHGHNTTFQALLGKTGLTKDDQLFILGDYVDRGPDSKGVLDTIIGLQGEGYRVTCILGNHEDMMLKAHYSPGQTELWMLNGGGATLESFGVGQPGQIPAKYIRFMESLPLAVETDKAVFVHAGLNMKNEDPLLDETSLLWITNWYSEINFDWLGSRKLIHGHVFRRRYEIERSLEMLDHFPVMGIDNGCFVDMPDYGRLCALDLTNRKLFFVRNTG